MHSVTKKYFVTVRVLRNFIEGKSSYISFLSDETSLKENFCDPWVSEDDLFDTMSYPSSSEDDSGVEIVSMQLPVKEMN